VTTNVTNTNDGLARCGDGGRASSTRRTTRVSLGEGGRKRRRWMRREEKQQD